MYNTSRIKLTTVAALIILLLLTPLFSQAQNRINMPYSIYGIGEIKFNHYYQNMGMAGISQGFRSNMSVNDVNPASYSAVDSTSFVFDATMVAHFYEQQTNDISQQSDYVSLGNISFAFPVYSWWSVGAGIKPYSLMGYNFRDVEEHPVLGTVNYVYQGSGGLTQLFLGSAIQPFEQLSLGLNVSYIFGDINREASVMSDSAGVYQTNSLRSNRARGWVLGFGIQYEFELPNNRNLILGATFGNDSDLDLSQHEFLRRRIPGTARYDTISSTEIGEGTLTLPQYAGFGVYSRINPNWSGGIDFQWQNWEDFTMPGHNHNFGNSYQLAAGVHYSPTIETYSTFFHRMLYSFGLRYGQSYLKYDDEAINEFGISFGAHIPVRRALSGIKLGFEYSQRGSADDQFMQESFYRMNIGINIYERWFIRRRFY